MEFRALFISIIITSAYISLTRANEQDFDISKQRISREEYKKRVMAFNEWYHNLNPTSAHLELRVDESGRARLHTLKDIKKGENYIEFTQSNIISQELIYDTPYAAPLKEMEQFYGYNDITNLLLYIVGEKFNERSFWKPYLDILPSQPNNLLFHWTSMRKELEPIVQNTGIHSRKYLLR